MKNQELIGKVHSVVYHQCQKRGYAAPADVLMDVGVLSKQKYEEWRFGEYYGAAKPPVRWWRSHLSGLSEPPRLITSYLAFSGSNP